MLLITGTLHRWHKHQLLNAPNHVGQESNVERYLTCLATKHNLKVKCGNRNKA